MTKPAPARCRRTIWKSDNLAPERRGSLPIWLDEDRTWHGRKTGTDGRPPLFGISATQVCLMGKILFGLPLRQTTGMIGSIYPSPAGLMRAEVKRFHMSALKRRALPSEAQPVPRCLNCCQVKKS